MQRAAYHPEGATGLARANITEIHKSTEEAEDADDASSDLLDGSETKTVTVGRGDTLVSIITKVGGEPAQAKAIVDAMAPVFAAQDLKAGQEVRFALVPAPSDTGQMDPVKVSVFAPGDIHLATVARNSHGDYVATTQAVDLTAADELKAVQTPRRATLYASFYTAALSQHIPSDTILKLLRVHSYDVDFKQKVGTGDTFEVFFDVPDGRKPMRRPARCSTPR